MKNRQEYMEAGLFEGDIMVDEGLGAAINIQERLWPKSNDGFVYVPISFPATASKDEKAAIARTVTEFKNNTCIRYATKLVLKTKKTSLFNMV